MNRQKTAEFLADKVLKRKRDWNNDSCSWDGFDRRKKEYDYSDEAKEFELIKFIYSPEGFFAIIDELKEDDFSSSLMESWSYFLHDMDMEAFYSAVLEAYK